MSSIFGASTNAPAQSNNIFGSAANTNNPAATPAGGSLFGNFGTQNTNNNQQQPGTSIFGNNTTTQQPSTSIFGNNTNIQQQQQQQQQQPSTSIFGNTNTNPNPQQQQQQSGNSLFGATNTTGAGSNMFGNNTGNSLFAKQPTNSLFGGSTNAPAVGTNPLFGSTAQPTAGGASFFATPPAGGQQQQQQQQQNPNQVKPSLFGGSTTNSTNPLFGGSTTNNAPTGSIFGGSTTGQTGTLFGSTNNAPTTGNNLGTSTLFGGSGLGASTLGTSALGKPPGGLVSSTLTSQNQSADAQVQFARLQEKIEGIAGAWDAQNPSLCRFQHYFYNIVDPSQVNLYGRPANAVNEALWQKAIRENPNPSRYVPVLAIGFDDLRDRVDAQGQQSAGQKENLLELQKKLQTLSTNHSTLTVPRLQRYSALQTQLTHRLLRLIQHLHLLIPSVRSSAISENEEALRGALEEVAAEVGVSNGNSSRTSGEVFGKGRLKSKLGELWAVIGALKAREESLKATMGGSAEWKIVDDESLARVAQILGEQQAGLAHLTKILTKDLKDLAVIMGTAGGAGEDFDTDSVLGSSLAGRDTSMRGSTLRLSALR